METESILTDRPKNFFDQLFPPHWRMPVAVLIALLATIAAANSSCSSASTTNQGPTPTPTPTPTATATGATPTPPPQNFVSMTYALATPTSTPPYGEIDGYGLLAAAPTSSPATTPAPTQVITVTHGQTIAFLNFDSGSHTASLLTPQSGVFPSTFNNVNGASASSPEFANITDAQFSTGNMTGASGGHPTFSKMYNTGPVTGIFLYGDFYDYSLTPSMRGIIIIQ